MVQDLVHPSLYPLIYDRSRVFRDEVVGVEDAIDRWSGKGDVIPKEQVDVPLHYNTTHGGGYEYSISIGGTNIHDEFWSDTYQWLPSNVKFLDDGSVKFTSYINNLHPTKHRDIYKTIEELIGRALPAWDYCIPCRRKHEFLGAGRTEPRFPRPSNPDDQNEANWTPTIQSITLPKLDDGEGVEEHKIFEAHGGKTFTNEDVRTPWGDLNQENPKVRIWEEVREPIQPEAPEFEAWDYGVKPGESLRERFKDIQVIVKMASIELTPEKPSFPAGGWHVEGQMNEHIVGTALYYLDSENITPSHLEFRMQTDSYQDDWNVGQDSFGWMEQVYGAKLRGGNCLQRYGSVETKQGRLLAFPNVFHHRVSPFELEDRTKPGHRRFIALWLVDPRTRIINTANVPPQQHSWWMEQAFGNLNDKNADKVPQTLAKIMSDVSPDHAGLKAAVLAGSGKPLPKELMDMVEAETGDLRIPMSLDEAKEHRLKLMDERTRFEREAEMKWSDVQYSFCEH